MPAEDAPPPNQRTRAAIGAVSLLVTVAAWLVLVLHYQYQVAWLGAYATLSDLLFLAGVAGIVLTRSAARWSAVRARDLARRLVILVVGIAAALLVSEYVTRFVFRHATSSGNPADYLAQHGGGPQVSSNSLGFREREVGPKDPNRYRIAVIGDSFTWGQGIEEADRYSNLLGGFLGPQFEVLNFGRPGHNMPEHLNDVDEVLKLRPDFVLLQLFINNFETATMRRPQTYTLLPQDLDAWMVRSSVVYRLLSDRWTLFLESVGFAESYADYLTTPSPRSQFAGRARGLREAGAVHRPRPRGWGTERRGAVPGRGRHGPLCRGLPVRFPARTREGDLRGEAGALPRSPAGVYQDPRPAQHVGEPV